MQLHIGLVFSELNLLNFASNAQVRKWSVCFRLKRASNISAQRISVKSRAKWTHREERLEFWKGRNADTCEQLLKSTKGYSFKQLLLKEDRANRSEFCFNSQVHNHKRYSSRQPTKTENHRHSFCKHLKCFAIQGYVPFRHLFQTLQWKMLSSFGKEIITKRTIQEVDILQNH